MDEAAKHRRNHDGQADEGFAISRLTSGDTATTATSLT